MTAPKKGDVWTYEYLWRREYEAGAEDGRKPRPTALVAIAVDKDGFTNLFILPVTTREPGADRLAMEIPQIELKRAGLASDLRLWVVLDEYNHDILEKSFHFDPDGRRGSFSPVFADKVLGAFIDAGRKNRTSRVPSRE